jgi:hypothetical protein
MAGAALPDGDLPRLARALLDEPQETAAADPDLAHPRADPGAPGDNLAAELGGGRERVRQLEASALHQLARAATLDRYRPLRWCTALAAQPGDARAATIPGASP